MSEYENEIERLRKKLPKPELKTRELLGHKKKVQKNPKRIKKYYVYLKIIRSLSSEGTLSGMEPDWR
jgi:hypothetical protein